MSCAVVNEETVSHRYVTVGPGCLEAARLARGVLPVGGGLLCG